MTVGLLVGASVAVVDQIAPAKEAKLQPLLQSNVAACDTRTELRQSTSATPVANAQFFNCLRAENITGLKYARSGPDAVPKNRLLFWRFLPESHP